MTERRVKKERGLIQKRATLAFASCTLSVSVDQSQRPAMEPLFGQAMAELSLVSWNLAHRRSKLAAQVVLISQLAPDIARFQEVIQSTRV